MVWTGLIWLCTGPDGFRIILGNCAVAAELTQSQDGLSFMQLRNSFTADPILDVVIFACALQRLAICCCKCVMLCTGRIELESIKTSLRKSLSFSSGKMDTTRTDYKT